MTPGTSLDFIARTVTPPPSLTGFGFSYSQRAEESTEGVRGVGHLSGKGVNDRRRELIDEDEGSEGWKAGSIGVVACGRGCSGRNAGSTRSIVEDW